MIEHFFDILRTLIDSTFFDRHRDKRLRGKK
jgi:hypothetical protein